MNKNHRIMVVQKLENPVYTEFIFFKDQKFS